MFFKVHKAINQKGLIKPLETERNSQETTKDDNL